LAVVDKLVALLFLLCTLLLRDTFSLLHPVGIDSSLISSGFLLRAKREYKLYPWEPNASLVFPLLPLFIQRGVNVLALVEDCNAPVNNQVDALEEDSAPPHYVACLKVCHKVRENHQMVDLEQDEALVEDVEEVRELVL